ncbi:hypothetical protein EVAR_36619_1 [Eumeta japonica]|uniref:Uncharacterized protein n=1 Tax=Eumeta variegata TaxID=151549 RepID=A0A4C1ZPM0_EUMVA|nr:hypothetical protein EVAR_36619_1 [Eumeta japonica]
MTEPEGRQSNSVMKRRSSIDFGLDSTTPKTVLRIIMTEPKVAKDNNDRAEGRQSNSVMKRHSSIEFGFDKYSRPNVCELRIIMTEPEGRQRNGGNETTQFHRIWIIMIEPEGRQSNSVLKRRSSIEFGFDKYSRPKRIIMIEPEDRQSNSVMKRRSSIDFGLDKVLTP